MIRCFLMSGLAGVTIVTSACADTLRLSRPAKVYAAPSTSSMVLVERPAQTDLTILLDGKQSNGYYQVALDEQGAGGVGWVYRTFGRRIPATLASARLAAPSASPVDDPLRDPTYTSTDLSRRYAARHLRIGKPQAVFERAREGYVLAQDARLKIPLWVQYELNREELDSDISRVDKFRADTTIPAGSRAELVDYRNSGFDRGHMAAAEDMSRTARLMEESFLLSNMAPQVGKGFNQNIWKNLEADIRGWVRARGKLTIITGPVFEAKADRVSYATIGTNAVAVPTHFYKIVVDARDNSNVEALAFLFPNQDLTGRTVGEFLASINEIEKLTGLNFLSGLPEATQKRVETGKAAGVW
jgi:endonuclease G